MNPSPLRYPGGKYKLYQYIEQLIYYNKCSTYIEPFCGGAALAFELLFNGIVKKVIINDFDYSIFCFWDCVLNHTDEFINKVIQTEITIEEWNHQKDIRENMFAHTPMDIAFSTFFLNRTNRSGIIDKAGPIGGYDQNGTYSIDCRFNKNKLIEQIRDIAKYRNDISLYNYDALDFIDNVILQTRKSFVFFDPPYFKKGPCLYKDFYVPGDHYNLSRTIITEMKNRKWIVTYDNVDEIKSMYSRMEGFEFSLRYSLQEKKECSEVMFFSKNTIRPKNERNLINIVSEIH